MVIEHEERTSAAVDGEVGGSANGSAVPTTLYRFYDADGALLYVGITSLAMARWVHHQAFKSWWPEIATARLEHFADRAAALVAESRAILVERPRYNVLGIEPPRVPHPRIKRPNGMGGVFQRRSDGRWVAKAIVDGRRLMRYARSPEVAWQLLRELLPNR